MNLCVYVYFLLGLKPSSGPKGPRTFNWISKFILSTSFLMLHSEFFAVYKCNRCTVLLKTPPTISQSLKAATQWRSGGGALRNCFDTYRIYRRNTFTIYFFLQFLSPPYKLLKKKPCVRKPQPTTIQTCS